MFSTVPFKGQKYSSIKKDCLKKGELFRDTEFPPNNKSLFFSKVDPDIEWKRPKELCQVPKLIFEGVACEDLNEGELGNCWFVSACSTLVQEPKLWQKVIPNHKEQEWTLEDQYAGIFHFQFWRYGAWVDVVVDDLLPTKNGQLVFCHSKSKNEFWSALLEKAYAKMYGDYESLSKGFTADALVDFTGGVAEKIQVEDLRSSDQSSQEDAFNNLKDAAENKALITCQVACKLDEVGSPATNGLIKGHGYIITDVKRIKVNKSLKSAVGADELDMLRLRNPWGTKEWTGAWSDQSSEWQNVTASEREKLGIKFKSEGEFWMLWSDFIRNFTNLDICHFVNTSFFSIKKTWTEALLHGEWSQGARGTPRDRAGGCSKHPSFLRNPQYMFDISGQQDTVMVSIEQDDTDAHRETGSKNPSIGFHIMKVEDNRKYRINIPGEKMAESPFLMTRSVFQKVFLIKGRYVIVPSTESPNLSGKFLLRLYTSGSANTKELTKDGPKSGLCSKGPAQVFRLKVIKAEDLEKPLDEKKTLDPFVIIKCEGESVKSVYAKNTQFPTWNLPAIYYRKKLVQPITVEVWNHNTLIDDFVGEARIEDRGCENPEVKEYKLFGRKKEKDVQKPGRLHIEITSSEELTAL